MRIFQPTTYAALAGAPHPLLKQARLSLLLCCLMLCGSPRPAWAHITETNMPDAVAQMEYRILLEFEPDNITARNKLGMIYIRLGKLTEAAAQFQQVLTLDPDNFDASDALGLVRLKENRPAEAERYFRQAITINPQDPLVHYHLGMTLDKTGRPEKAATAFSTALRLSLQQQDRKAEQTIRECLARRKKDDRQ